MTNPMKDFKTIDLTINIRKITQGDSWRWKTKQAIKRIKQHLLKYYKLTKSDADVSLAPELNKHIFSRGMKNPPKKIRVRVEPSTSRKDANRRVFRVSQIIVGGFKGLSTECVVE
ncbi:60S ribosomal protein L31 [Pseudoloma neurophilia]|uniref:60S ribosomal protein L31 n=1 Tax=Pseudoloma neurophilia TaxID=146866 RepID=A0A0R0LR97_9MICR|nr:60S ribosomal protein L31 [Pseudoloma neurophilia]